MDTENRRYLERCWQLPSTNELESIAKPDICEDSDMSTAVAEKPVTQATQVKPSKPLSKPPRSFDEVAQAVSAITKQPIDIAANLVIATVPQSEWHYEQGALLLPETATRDTLISLVEQLKETIDGMSSTPAPAPTIEPAPAPTNGIAPAPAPEAIEPATEAQPKPARKPRTTTAAAKKPAAKKTAAAKKTTGTRARKSTDTAE